MLQQGQIKGATAADAKAEKQTDKEVKVNSRILQRS